MAGVAAPGQKNTLHSFWSIRSAPQPAAVPMAVDLELSSMESLLRCEDCDEPLRGGFDAMELDDGAVELGSACSSCMRHICDTCAVLANERVCLACASRRAWLPNGFNSAASVP